MPEPSRQLTWTIHSERVVDSSRKAIWSIADVELPDGVQFEQYVYRAPEAAMALLVVDGSVLMMRRHRFVIDRWVWELPGGYAEPGESLEDCAARECVEETGWRPTALRPLVSFQPWVATADAANHLFISYEAEQVTETPSDVNEAAQVRWIPLADVRGLIVKGEIVGSASVIGVQAVLLEGR